MPEETMIKEVKERNLTQSTFLNAASSLLNYGTGIVVALLLNPLLLTYLGSSLFGVWKICQRLLTYISAADGRASQALKWTIASRRSTTEIEQKQREIGCAIVVWLRFLPLSLVAGSLISWFSPWLIRGLPAEYFTITRLTCAILVVNLLLFPLKSIPESVMVGMNLGYKTTWINAFGNLIGGVLMAVAAWIGWGLVGLATAILVASLFRGVAILFQARRKLPWMAIRKPEKGEVGEFFNFSIWVLAWTFINKFLLSSDVIILGLVSSASLVASYTLTFYVVQTLINLSAIMVSSGMPGMGDIVGRGELKKAASIRSEIMASSWLMAVIVGSMVLLWNRPFISLWVGAEHFVGFGENFLMVMLMTQLIFIRNDAFIVDVTLQIRTKVLWGAFSTVVGLALALLLGFYLSSPITGVLAGLVGGRLILTVLYPMLVGQQLKENLLKISPEFVREALVMSAMYGISCYGAPRIRVESWVELIMFGTISLFVIGGVAFVLGLNGEQRRQILARARQLSFR